MGKNVITIKGAKEHNLKNIDLEIPRDKLIVVTGLSGSGKSSLAFDTIYAEGQRRYVESLSSYARQFLEQLQKPDVEYIEGLSPAISIEQRTAGSNPRSTVGTQTEIYDYMRLLFARIGTPHCPKCRKPIRRQTSQEIVGQISKLPDQTNLLILAPVIRGRKGEYKELFQKIKKDGFIRVRVDGNIYELDKSISLDKSRAHTIEIVVDRIVLKEGVRKRLTDSVETALEAGKGMLVASLERSPVEPKDILFNEQYACADCGISLGEVSPRIFSFNSPYGACPQCDGLGNKMEIDPDLVIPDKAKPVLDAVDAWRRGGKGLYLYYRRLLRSLGNKYDFDVTTPFKDLPKNIKKLFLYGEGSGDHYAFEGVIPNLERRFKETESEFIKAEINKYMSVLPCPACKGSRLKDESLAVKIQGKNISEVSTMSIKALKEFLSTLSLTETEKTIAVQVLKEIIARLRFMVNVGLDYLTLDRRSSTLSGGEAQRIRLATQIGSGLVGVIYILDEPSIGLHQKDNSKLLDTLTRLRDLGNTLIVVEHDEATIRAADYIIDLGPGAGEYGGNVVARGSLKDVIDSKESLTGKYLRGQLKISIPAKRKSATGKSLKVMGAREHNLKNIDVEIPLGLFICVTGVSGSGKSTLVDDILYKSLARKFYRSKEAPGAHRKIDGMQNIDKVIVIDQSPIGRTPRSNPATYTGAFAPLREIFSRLPDAKVRGYKPGRFSFNVKGGRCEACTGDGIKKIEMHFLPDIYVQCEVCKGKRFNEQTLDVKYKGHSIADCLAMSVEEALRLFENIPSIRNKFKTLHDVGLGYIKIGQSATTLSGGEAQRIKLAAELSKTSTGRTFYILDEPTTGLHFADVDKLLDVLQALVRQGNTVLVIEHNLDVIKTADHIIDLGPEGGDAGGEVVAEGTPEDVAGNKRSYTGQYLKKVLVSLILMMFLLSGSQLRADGLSEDADFAYVKKAFNDGSYDISQTRLEALIKNYPQTQYLYKAHVLLGRCCYRQNNYTSALYEFEMVLGSPAASEFQDEALYWSGEIYVKRGDFKKALEYYQKIIDDFPASKYLGYALYSKGWAYYRLGLFEDAIRCFSEVILNYPMDKVAMEAQFRLGECRYLSAQYEKAEAAFDMFIQNFPVSENTADAYYLNGESKFYLGKYKESIAALERALSISPGAKWAPFAVYRIGKALYETGECAVSIEQLKKCLAMTNNDFIKSSSLLELIRNYEKTGATDEALRICAEVEAGYPDDNILREVYYHKARILYGEKKYIDAERVCKEAIAKFSKDFLLDRVHYELGWIYIMQDRREEAMKEFAWVAAKAKDINLIAGALCKIGDSYFDKGDYQKATESYDVVLDKYPEGFQADYAQYQIANISTLNAKYDQAILAYQTILVNFPNTNLRAKVIFQIGLANFNRGDYERAASEFENFIREFPDDKSAGQAKLYLADSLYNMSKYEAALAIFGEIDKSFSDRRLKMMAAYQAGWSYYNLRKEPQAVAAFAGFLENYPDSDLAPDARFWFGEYYRSRREYARANEYFESILKDFPSSDMAAEALTQSALALSEEGKSDEAIAKFEELAKRFSGSDSGRSAYRKIAKIDKGRKKFAQAIEYYKKALTDDNNELNAQIQYEIAESYEEFGGLLKASEEYLKVPRLYQKGAFWAVRAQLKCAKIFERLEKFEDASRLYEKLAAMEIEESDFAKSRIEWLKGKNRK